MCNGICLTVYDLGIDGYGGQIAYAHPHCEAHGDGPFEPEDDE